MSATYFFFTAVVFMAIILIFYNLTKMHAHLDALSEQCGNLTTRVCELSMTAGEKRLTDEILNSMTPDVITCNAEGERCEAVQAEAVQAEAVKADVGKAEASQVEVSQDEATQADVVRCEVAHSDVGTCDVVADLNDGENIYAAIKEVQTAVIKPRRQPGAVQPTRLLRQPS